MNRFHFYDMDSDVETGDVSGGHGYINSQTIYQNNGLSSLINSNNSDDIEINGDFNNGDVIYGNGFINSHTLSQRNKSISFNDMDTDVKNVDVSGAHCFMNSHTLAEAKNASCIYSTKKGYENVPNVSEIENTGL